MRISKVRKMYSNEFDKLILNLHGEQFLTDYRNTYYYNKLFQVISENNIYIPDYKKPKAKLRITFPLFLFTIMVINIVMCIVWLFSGSAVMKSNWHLTKLMIRWDRYCNFNII